MSICLCVTILFNHIYIFTLILLEIFIFIKNYFNKCLNAPTENIKVLIGRDMLALPYRYQSHPGRDPASCGDVFTKQSTNWAGSWVDGGWGGGSSLQRLLAIKRPGLPSPNTAAVPGEESDDGSDTTGETIIL